eukprot:COSAG02_NODE_6798_length_3355_cov_1.721130_4_plen_88_part_00
MPVCRHWSVRGPLGVRPFAYLRSWAGEVLPHAEDSGRAQCRRSRCSGRVGDCICKAKSEIQEKDTCSIGEITGEGCWNCTSKAGARG